MSDNRFVSIKFENFHLPMEARIYQAPDFGQYEVWFHPGLEDVRWTKLTAATFADAFQLAADLSVSTRREFPAT